MAHRGIRSTALAAAAILAVGLATPAHAGPAKPRTVEYAYTAPGGATGHYPQVFLQFQIAPHPALAREVVGGVQVGGQGTEDRFEVVAADATGRPVAISLYWYEDPKKDPVNSVICGKTAAPVRIMQAGAVHAIVTAGDGCPGSVSAPTRGVIKFTWSTAPKPKGR